MKSTRYCCQIFIKLDISQQVLKKNTKYQISFKSVQGSRGVP
jgi:hypothetical protein